MSVTKIFEKTIFTYIKTNNDKIKCIALCRLKVQRNLHWAADDFRTFYIQKYVQYTLKKGDRKTEGHCNVVTSQTSDRPTQVPLSSNKMRISTQQANYV